MLCAPDGNVALRLYYMCSWDIALKHWNITSNQELLDSTSSVAPAAVLSNHTHNRAHPPRSGTSHQLHVILMQHQTKSTTIVTTLCICPIDFTQSTRIIFSVFFFWLPFRFDFGLNKHRARCMSYSEFTWWCPAVKSIPINLWFVCLCASLMGGPLRYALARPSHNYIMPRKVLSARPPNTFCDISGISRSSGFIWRNSLRMKWCSCIRTDTFTIRMMYIYS